MYDLIQEVLSELNQKALEHPSDYFRQAVQEVTDLFKQRMGTQGQSENVKLLQEFLTEKKLAGCSQGTLKNYHLELLKFIHWIAKPIEQVSANDIKSFIAKSEKLKRNSITTKISILKSFFHYLMVEEIIKRDPTIKIPRIREEKRQPKFLSMVEILRLREACKNDIRTRAILEILFETGCRVSEIVGTNREDINWEKRSIKIFGKGSKERVVYFHVNTYFYLTKYLATREDTHPALFITKIKPTERLHSRSIQMIIKKLGEKATLTKNIHPHALRHTFGTYLLNKGMDISIVSELLGHERLSTTQIYAKLTETRKSAEYMKYFV